MDWWALGVLLYEMLAGRSPFDIVGATDNPDQNTEDYLFQVSKPAGNPTQILYFKVILEKTIRIPRSLSVKAASILKGFLNKNPADRLGCHRDSGFGEIMNHPFFKVMGLPSWETLISQSVMMEMMVVVIVMKVMTRQNIQSSALHDNRMGNAGAEAEGGHDDDCSEYHDA